MLNEPDFRCPVCRAAQSLRDTCRRCQADLSLVTRAHRRLLYLKAQQDQMLTGGNQDRRQQLAAELRWLAPSR